MFMGPLEASKPWSNQGVEGAHKFIQRVYRALIDNSMIVDEETKELEVVYHETVKKVTADFEALAFNTAISQMMIFMNEVYKINKISKQYAEGFIKMFSCICPHVGEEMWNILGNKDSIAYEKWPEYDENKLVKSSIKIAVQICGKVREIIEVPVDASEKEIEEIALNNPGIKQRLEGKEIKRVIIIKGKICNIVAI